MKTVQFTKDHHGYRKGEVLTVDDTSAASLIDEQKVAQEYDGKSKVTPRPPRPGVVHVARVADADYPEQGKPKDETDSPPPPVVASTGDKAPTK